MRVLKVASLPTPLYSGQESFYCDIAILYRLGGPQAIGSSTSEQEYGSLGRYKKSHIIYTQQLAN